MADQGQAAAVFETISSSVKEFFENPDVQQTLRAIEQVTTPVDDTEGQTNCQPVGRPKKEVDIHFACDLLFELHMPLTKVAKLCDISSRTLSRHLHAAGIDASRQNRYTNLSDSDLERCVRGIKMDHRNAGLSYLTGHLRSRGVYVQRRRVLEMLHRVDPVGVLERLSVAIARREYSVPCPNYMWHLDGHHKLVNWKLVIHACVDGFSRTIIYLNCADNNRAESTEQLFLDAASQYGWPLKVRTDYGGENQKVWDAMLEHRGQERCVIVGSSVHNTRVERMHLETKTQVGDIFKSIFLDMEREEILDRDNQSDLFCLHYVFLPRINKSLQEFRSAHNHHPLRTEGNQSPMQLFFTHMDLIAEHEAAAEVDYDGGPGLTVRELRDTKCELPFVPVNSIRCPLSDEQLVELEQRFDPLASDDHRQIYLDVTQFVQECLQDDNH